MHTVETKHIIREFLQSKKESKDNNMFDIKLVEC